MKNEERMQEIVAILSDGIPRTYVELGAQMGLTSVQVYHIVRLAIEMRDDRRLMHRSFPRSNRHYVFLKKHASKLGAVWLQDSVNKPVTFAVLKQLGQWK